MIQKTFELKPLSVNRAWQGRRFKTPEYKNYERDLNLLGGHFETIKGNVELVIELFLKNDKRTDIDNCVKPIMDYLTKVGAWEDDRKVTALHIYKEHADRDSFRITIVDNNDLERSG